MNPSRIAYSTLAFPDATLAEATTLGRSWGYAGVELRLIDGQLIDSSVSAAERLRVKQTIAAARLPIVSVGSSIILSAEGAGSEARLSRDLAADRECTTIRVYAAWVSEGSVA